MAVCVQVIDGSVINRAEVAKCVSAVSLCQLSFICTYTFMNVCILAHVHIHLAHVHIHMLSVLYCPLHCSKYSTISVFSLGPFSLAGRSAFVAEKVD